MSTLTLSMKMSPKDTGRLFSKACRLEDENKQLRARAADLKQQSVPDAEYIRALQDAFDIIQADANTEQNYGSLCRIGDVLVKLRAGQEQGDGWIKCSERRADVLDVWIKMTDGSVVACWSQLDGDFYWNGGGSESYILENTVTHWKPRQQEQGE